MECGLLCRAMKSGQLCSDFLSFASAKHVSITEKSPLCPTLLYLYYHTPDFVLLHISSSHVFQKFCHQFTLQARLGLEFNWIFNFHMHCILGKKGKKKKMLTMQLSVCKWDTYIRTWDICLNLSSIYLTSFLSFCALHNM